MKKISTLILSLCLLFPVYGTDQNEEVFGLFKDLHEPFIGYNHEDSSPVLGLDRQIIESARMHAYQGPEPAGFERPKSRSIDPNCYPQKATAALLERLFTSHVGLMVNSDKSDRIHQWLTPLNIGLIFNVISEPSFYELPNAVAALRLAEAVFVSRDTYDQLKKKAKKQNVQDHALEGFMMKQAALKPPLKFADLLVSSLFETHGEKAVVLGLPPSFVKLTLLVFMWETKKAKSDLIPFYESLSGKIINKEAVKRIIWAGEGSFYTEKDYWAAKKLKGKLSLEMSRLLRLGYARFEDRLPPEIHYGISFVEIANEVISFSDCGESSLRYLLMALIFDPDKRIYDWERLVRLRELGIMVMEEAIDFFHNYCKTPAVADTSRVRNRWAAIMALLNQPDDPNPVQMLHPSKENGKVGIDAGAHNIMNALGHIIRDPLWNHPVDSNKPIQHKLNRICEIFSPSCLLPGIKARWEWEFASVNPKDIAPQTEFWPNQRLRDSFNATVIFKLNGYHVYEWHIQPQHFDFNRANPTYLGAEAELDSKPFAIPNNMTKEAFPRYLYNSDLRTVHGRLIAINRIYWFKKTFNESTHDHLLSKWLEPTGKYMSYYGDIPTNEIIMEILRRSGKSVDEIVDMNIAKLSSNLLWQRVKAQDIESVARMFKRDTQLYIQQGQPYHECEFADMVRIASVAMLKAKKEDLEIMLKAGLEDYFQAIARRSLKSLVFMSLNRDLIKGYSQLIQEGVVKLDDDPLQLVSQFFGGQEQLAGMENSRFLMKWASKYFEGDELPDACVHQ